MKLRVLTPVHIGSGEKVTRATYYHEGNRVYVLDLDIVQRALGTWRAGQFFDRVALGMEQQGLDHFLKGPGISPRERDTIGRNLKETASYSLSAPHGIPGEFSTFIKASGTPPAPYIPATEIKGALRTAVIYRLLKQDRERGGKTWQSIQRRLTESGPSRSLVQQMEAGLLRDRRDALYDVLKFLWLPDSRPVPLSALYVGKVEVISGTGKRIPIWCELLRPCVVEFHGEAHPPSPWMESSRRELAMNTHQATKAFVLESAWAFSKDLLEDYGPAGKELAAQNTPERPLLRLGKHKGYLASTVGLLLKEAGLLGRIAATYPRRSRTGLFPASLYEVRGPAGDGPVPPGWARLEEW